MERPNLNPAQKKMMRSIIIAIVLVSAMIFVSIGAPTPKEEGDRHPERSEGSRDSSLRSE